MFFRSSIEHTLSGWTDWFILSVRTAQPAAGTAHSFLELADYSLHMVGSSLLFLHESDPANPFIARQGSEVLPFSERCFIRSKSPA